MPVFCTNQDTAFLLAQCAWEVLFIRQEEEMSPWHENAIVFLPLWETT